MMKFAAVGDALVQRRIPADYEGLKELNDWMEGTDARYFNLETTVNEEGECFGSQFDGGSYLRIDPANLEDMHLYGFNMVSFCNNHSLDYSYDGLVKTIEHVKKSGFVQSGCGMNLDAASAPGYLETKKGRVALIGCTASCHETGLAGRQSRRVKGRPGVNLIRSSEKLIVTPEQMKVLKEITDKTEINAARNISIAEGYSQPDPAGILKMGTAMVFEEGPENARVTACNKTDLERVAKAIYEASFTSEQILVAIHSHQLSGSSKENPAQFLQEFAHFCIDQGADAVIGHGPHLLRPIEIYKGKPIFYSLGDFILQNENIPFLPEDYYVKYGLDSNAAMRDVFKNRSRGFVTGLQAQPKMLESVIPRWEVEDGKMVKLELLAIELGFDKGRARGGLPAPAKDSAILERLAKMSEPYGTKMEISGNKATVIL